MPPPWGSRSSDLLALLVAGLPVLVGELLVVELRVLVVVVVALLVGELFVLLVAVVVRALVQIAAPEDEPLARGGIRRPGVRRL